MTKFLSYNARTGLGDAPTSERMRALVEVIRNSWNQPHILVVGDVMLDRFLWGDVERISPEAPVPIVRVGIRSDQPGGAANVAMNIAGLGARVTVAGFSGEDSDGAVLERLLKQAGVGLNLIKVPSHPTISKLRIIGGHQQMLRLDVEQAGPYQDHAYAALKQGIDSIMGEVQLVVLSDYAKGVLRNDICRAVMTEARHRNIPVVVHLKHTDWSRYAGALTICANLSELAAITGVSAKDVDGVLTAATAMLPELGIRYLTVTLRGKGMAVLYPDGGRIFPANPRDTFDISGAADTVVATMALALASGLSIEEASPLANRAAGIVVGKTGIVPITRDEILADLMADKSRT